MTEVPLTKLPHAIPAVSWKFRGREGETPLTLDAVRAGPGLFPGFPCVVGVVADNACQGEGKAKRVR